MNLRDSLRDFCNERNVTQSCYAFIVKRMLFA